MPIVEFKGKTFSVDEDGFIDDYENWCEEWVQWVMKQEGLEELTEDHRIVIKFLREYFERMGIAPRIRVLLKNTGFDKDYIWKLFPSGPGKGACKIAGIPKPTGCV